MSRRRLALAIVAFVCVANLYVDYALLLRNPEEQEAQLQRILRFFLPNYAPSVQRTEVEFLSGKLVLHDVVLHEAGDPSRKLVRIPRLEVDGTGFPVLSSLSLKAIEPEVMIRLDESGLNLDLGGEEDDEAGSLLIDLELSVEGGRLRFVNALPGMRPDEGQLLISDINASLNVQPDTSFRGGGSLRVDALFPQGHMLAGENRAVPGLPNLRMKGISEGLRFDLTHASGEALQAGLKGTLEISDAIRSVIPPKFQDKVYREIGPQEGLVDLTARVRREGEGTTRIGVALAPRNVTVVPQGFPIPLTEINGGTFEVSVALPGDGGDPALLGVTWEGILGRVDRAGPDGGHGRGRLVSRGAVYPGRDQEAVTIYMFVDVLDLPLSERLVQAFPDDIRKVYRRFDPQGVLPRGKVQIFKGPFERDVIERTDGTRIMGVLQPSASEEVLLIRDHRGELVGVHRAEVADVERYDKPAISVFVPQLGGALSAMYEDIPVRLQDIHGHFTLNEGANVEIYGEGKLEIGGTARVRAMVMHGDVISVDVWGKDVPLGDGKRAVGALPGKGAEMVAPFDLHGGSVDFHTRVEKTGPEQQAQPKIDVDLKGVSFAHPTFPKELTASGKLRVIPWLDPAGELREIELGLDVDVHGEGVIGVVASGTLLLPPEQPEEITFEADLSATANRIDLAEVPDFLELKTELGADGVLTGVSAQIRGPRDLDILGSGHGLRAKVRRFPYRTQVDAFDVGLRDRTVLLREVRGRGLAGGRYEVRGTVGLPGAGGDEAGVDLSVEADRLQVEPELLEALPEAVRGPLASLRPRGPLSTAPRKRLRLVTEPGRRPHVEGELDLNGVTAYMDAFHTDMATLKDDPVRDVRGRVVVEPDRIRLQELTGKFLDSPAKMTGWVGLPGEPEGAEDPPEVPFDITAALSRLTVNDHAQALAGPRAAPFFESFPAEGPVGLTFRVHRGKERDDTTHIDLLARPAGMTVIPQALVPVPITGVEGEIRLADGEPVLVDIKGYLEPEGYTPPEDMLRSRRARIYVRRDRSREDRFPGGGSDGRVFYVWVQDFQRFQDPRHRAAFERRLPASWLSSLTSLDPEGRMDVEAWVYQPTRPLKERLERLKEQRAAGLLSQAEHDRRRANLDSREAVRWVAEVDLKGLGFTTGLRLDGIHGKARARGRLTEFEKGSCEGELELRKLDWLKQTFHDVKAEFRLEDGVLWLGRKGAPMTARLYPDASQRSGEFKAVQSYDFESGRYRGWLGLVDGSLATLMKELDEAKRASGPKDRPTLLADLEAARRVGDDAQVEQAEHALAEHNKRREELLGKISRARQAGEPERVERLQAELARMDGTGPKTRVPYQGKLFAVMEYAGGGVDLAGQPIELHGKGSVVLEEANIIDVPQLQLVKTVVNAVSGNISTSKILENMELSFDLKPDRIAVRRLRLSGEEMAVLAKGGWIRYDQRLKLTLVPFETEGLYDVLAWLPLTGYHITGTLDDYEWRTLPSILSPEWIRKQLIPGADDD